nr:protein elicitor protein [Colletotrichum truncatum]KAF6788389.1 protein elicitor protein [Colletotrichum truncatum]
MRVNTAAIITALIASVSAAPVTGGNGIDAEELIINDFAARHQQDGSVVSVGLHITGHDATNLECSKTDGVVLGEVYNCGDSKYSFSLVKGRFDTWGVHVYHRWGVAEWRFWLPRCPYHLPCRPPPDYRLHSYHPRLVLYWKRLKDLKLPQT